MIQYVSTKGGTTPVHFETAVLNGRPADGGLYVPTSLPEISLQQLQKWKNLSYTELAFEILSLFIDDSVLSESELKNILHKSFVPFFHPEKIPTHHLKSKNGVYLQELFHGPTLSFKDVAMGFVVNLFDFFLKRKNKHMSIVVATSGDTGPAAAHASIGLKTLDTWTIYPEGFITEEQERQMTTISSSNVHAVRINGSINGSDDLDELVDALFANDTLKEELNLSSVNSTNWARVMMQTVHYFYGYLQVVDKIGEALNFAVPTGAFGNLCAGTLAREMGLPVDKFILSNNQNECLDKLFKTGLFQKSKVINSHSCAIDISVPINFWRYLYFSIGQNPDNIKSLMQEFSENDQVLFDAATHERFSKGFLSATVSDERTLDTIREVFQADDYLLDPHSAVAVAAYEMQKENLSQGSKTLCLCTAHPSKFPATIREALNQENLPQQAVHFSIESSRILCQRFYDCKFDTMYEAVSETMKKSVQQKESLSAY